MIVGALPPVRGLVTVLTGGTSDLPVAREAEGTSPGVGAGLIRAPVVAVPTSIVTG